MIPKRVNRVMFSMGIADLLMGLILLPQAYRESMIKPEIFNSTDSTDSTSDHYLDEPFCKILTAGTWLSVTTSIYTFTIVSVARYLGTVHEALFERYFSPETAYKSILTCWLCGLLHAIPLLTSWNNEDTSDFTTCSMPMKNDRWVLWSGVTVFIVPTLVILVSYGLVLHKVRQSEEGMETGGNYTTFVLSLLTLAFLLCWWPAMIYLSIKWYGEDDSRAFYFGSTNSLINPLLFITLNTTLRRKAKAFFTGIADVCLCRGKTGCKSGKTTADPESPVRDLEPTYFKVDDD